MILSAILPTMSYTRWHLDNVERKRIRSEPLLNGVRPLYPPDNVPTMLSARRVGDYSGRKQVVGKLLAGQQSGDSLMLHRPTQYCPPCAEGRMEGRVKDEPLISEEVEVAAIDGVAFVEVKMRRPAPALPEAGLHVLQPLVGFLELLVLRKAGDYVTYQKNHFAVDLEAAQKIAVEPAEGGKRRVEEMTFQFLPLARQIFAHQESYSRT